MSALIKGAKVDRATALAQVLPVAKAASELVMRVYASAFDVEFKEGDDPVTRADKEANALICEGLSRLFPGMPIVAEESPPSDFEGFESQPAAWFVDPVDGTREFVAKNGEFAVMIGLAEEGRATLGVLVLPAEGRTLVGIPGELALEILDDGTRKPLSVSKVKALEGASVVVSRSHRSPSLLEAIDRIGPRVVVPTGSSGVKAARVALGLADVYLQPGPAGMRWDACAPEAVVRAAGGELTDARGSAFRYDGTELVNAHGLIGTNGLLHDAVIDRVRGGA